MLENKYDIKFQRGKTNTENADNTQHVHEHFGALAIWYKV